MDNNLHKYNAGNNSDGSAINQKHYQKAEKQPIEIMQDYFTAQEFYGFCLGNTLKYILRSRFKGYELQDMEKAYQYLDWALKCLHGEKVNPLANAKDNKDSKNIESAIKYYMDCNSHLPKAWINSDSHNPNIVSLSDFKAMLKNMTIKDSNGNEYDIILKKKSDNNKHTIVNTLLIKDTDDSKSNTTKNKNVSLDKESKDKLDNLIIQEYKELTKNRDKSDTVLQDIKGTYRDRFRDILKEYGLNDTDTDK